MANKSIEYYLWDTGNMKDDWAFNDTLSKFYRLFYFLSGEATYDSEHEHTILKSGKAYVLPIGTNISVKNIAKDTKLLWVHFFTDTLKIDKILEIDFKEHPRYKILFELLLDISTEVGAWKPMIDCLNIFWFYLNNDFYNLYVKDEGIQRIIEYIKDNYSKDLTNKMFASLIYVNEKYLIQLMKKTLGVTPHKYLLRYRLTIAGGLLTNGARVSEVSEACGFSDEKVFTRAFNKYFGKSPSQHKKDNKLSNK